MGIPSFINLWIGRTAEHFGLHIQRTGNKPCISADAIALALALIRPKSPRPTIVQIGAFDGSFQDPLRNILNSKADYENAVLVEPQQHAVTQLKSMYQDYSNVTIEPSAIGTQDGTIKLYTPKNELLSAIATTDPGEIYKRGYNESEVSVTSIPCLTLKSLMQKHSLNHIDLLQMDCEGIDGQIITQFLQDDIHPAAIHFEHTNLHSTERIELRNLLDSHGYDVIEYDYDCLSFQRALYGNCNK